MLVVLHLLRYVSLSVDKNTSQYYGETQTVCYLWNRRGYKTLVTFLAKLHRLMHFYVIYNTKVM